MNEEEGEGVFCTIGPNDYRACKEALESLGAVRAEVFLTAARFGEREGWKAVTEVWEDIHLRHIERTGRKDFEIAQVIMFNDGTCRVFEADISVLETDIPEGYKPPWQRYIDRPQQEPGRHD